MSSNKIADVRAVPLSSIRPNPVALRGVKKDSDAYRSVRDSIAEKGIITPISVREMTDEATQDVYFEIIDGLHRFSGACDNGLESVPVNVLTADEMGVLELQIVGNLVRVETKPVEYTKQLQRMMHMNPTLTISDVAAKISQSPAWVSGRLGLLKLDEKIQKLVDDNLIPIANAHALAKLPLEEQGSWAEAAASQGSGEFVGQVNNRLKALRSERMTGRPSGPAQFAPVAHVRGKPALVAEYETPKVGPAAVAALGLTTAAEGFNAGIQWALQLDAASIDLAKADFEKRQKEAAQAAAKAKADKAAKKAAEAAAAVAG